MVGPWTVLAFSRYFDEMAGPYNTATMALARYLPIALAAYIVSMRIRDDQLPMFAAIGIWLFNSYRLGDVGHGDIYYGPGFFAGAYGNNRRDLFNGGSYWWEEHGDWIRRNY